jgi:hypothetical protein
MQDNATEEQFSLQSREQRNLGHDQPKTHFRDSIFGIQCSNGIKPVTNMVKRSVLE